LTKPGAPVIALMGDGSMGFHLSEFDTAARSNSPFVLIVGNDAKWNAEFQIQLRDFGPQRMMGCELNATRYDQAVVALGCEGGLVTRPDEMAPALDKALKSGRPTCLNVSLESHPAPTVRRG
jgi:acetolactate synthase-1/2/3 large subunit